MESEKKTTQFCRDSEIELLRIVAMFFIVIHHLIVHGSHLTEVTNLPLNTGTYQKLFYEAFVLFPVDCFILISGYYGISLKIKKALSMWVQCFCYSVGITLLFLFLAKDVEIKPLIKSFFPITFGIWWFITCYFFLMLISPGLNFLAQHLEKNVFHYLLLVGLVLNCFSSFVTGNISLGGSGSTLVNFVFVYFVGRYLRIHRDYLSFSKPSCLLSYSLCCLAMAAASFILAKYFHGKGIWRLYRFNNPLIIFEAVAVFYFFKAIKIESTFVNKTGGMVLSVYLIHGHDLVRTWVYDKVLRIEDFSNQLSYIWFLLLFAIIIFVCSLFIEIIRRKLSNPVLSLLYSSDTFEAIESKLSFLDRGDTEHLTNRAAFSPKPVGEPDVRPAPWPDTSGDRVKNADAAVLPITTKEPQKSRKRATPEADRIV